MKKVLLIDDEYMFYEKEFSQLPVEMFYAGTAQDGIELLLAKQKVDVILVDGYINGIMIGPAVVRTLRRNHRIKTKIVMFSSDDELNMQGITAGANSAWNKKMFLEEDWQKSFLEALDINQ